MIDTTNIETICRTGIPGYDPWADPAECTFDPEAAMAPVRFFREQLTIPDGDKAGIPFEPMPWQQAILGNLFGWFRPDGTRRYRQAFILVPQKNGKMMDLDTVLPTPTGWTTIGEVKPGDTLFDERGWPCTVKAVHPIDPSPESYRVEFSNGEVAYACADHLWLTRAIVDRPGDKSSGTSRRPLERVRNTREIFETQHYGKNNDSNHRLFMPGAISPNPDPAGLDRDLQIDPYVFGCWLGDGDSDAPRLTAADEDIQHYVEEFARRGYEINVKPQKNRAARLVIGWRESLYVILREMGVKSNKHIPQNYLRASVSARRDLLRGLMDTDGHAAKNGNACEFTTISPALRDGMCELLASLGIKYSCREKRATLDGKDMGAKYRIQFAGEMGIKSPFLLERKRSRIIERISGNAKRSRTVTITSVTPCEPRPMRCITVDSPSGLFRFGRTMLYTHNTPLASGILLFTQVARGFPGSQAFFAAADRSQASIGFDDAAAMVMENDELSATAKIMRSYKTIEFAGTGQIIRALSSDAKTKHGLRPYVFVADEIHAHQNGDLVSVLHKKTAGQAEPLEIYITTADFERDSMCNEKHDAALAVLDDHSLDPYLLPVIYAAGKDDDWRDPEVWKRCNPSFGITKKEEYFHQELRKIEITPSELNEFLRLDLNVRTGTKTFWLTLEDWDKCGTYDDSELEGYPCYGGLDMSSTNDLTAFSLYWPHIHAIKSWAWVPESQLGGKNRIQYFSWHNAGHLMTTPGNAIDAEYIEAAVVEICKGYNLQTLAFDRWGARDTSTRLLNNHGLPLAEIGQGYASMSAPAKEIEKLVLDHRLRHQRHPVERWCFGNACIRFDPAGNIKPEKPSPNSAKKVDIAVAVVMAKGAAMASEPEQEAAVFFA